MHHRPLRAIAVACIALAVAACATGAPSSAPTPTPAAATYDEAQDAICSAFGAMLRAVGNPDTASPSVLSKALDDAVAAGDVPAAERAAASMTAELETARQLAAAAGRHEPVRPTAAAMDKLFVAFEAHTAAKVAAARKTPGAIEPQAALEQAGGLEAWTATLQGIQSMTAQAGASATPCKAFSGTP